MEHPKWDDPPTYLGGESSHVRPLSLTDLGVQVESLKRFFLLNPLHLTWFPQPLASLQGGHKGWSGKGGGRVITQHSLPPPLTRLPPSDQAGAKEYSLA